MSHRAEPTDDDDNKKKAKTPPFGAEPTPANRERLMLEFNEHQPNVFWEPESGQKTWWSDNEPQVPCMYIPGELIPWGASLRSEKKNEIWGNTKCSISWRGPREGGGQGKTLKIIGSLPSEGGCEDKLMQAATMALEFMWEM